MLNFILKPRLLLNDIEFSVQLPFEEVAKIIQVRKFTCFDSLNIVDIFYGTVTLQWSICLLVILVEVNRVCYRSARNLRLLWSISLISKIQYCEASQRKSKTRMNHFCYVPWLLWKRSRTPSCETNVTTNTNLKFSLKRSFACTSDIFDTVICCHRLSAYSTRTRLMARYLGLIHLHPFRIREESSFCSDTVCKMSTNKLAASFHITARLYIINIKTLSNPSRRIHP